MRNDAQQKITIKKILCTLSHYLSVARSRVVVRAAVTSLLTRPLAPSRWVVWAAVSSPLTRSVARSRGIMLAAVTSLLTIGHSHGPEGWCQQLSVACSPSVVARSRGMMWVAVSILLTIGQSHVPEGWCDQLLVVCYSQLTELRPRSTFLPKVVS